MNSLNLFFIAQLTPGYLTFVLAHRELWAISYEYQLSSFFPISSLPNSMQLMPSPASECYSAAMQNSFERCHIQYSYCNVQNNNTRKNNIHNIRVGRRPINHRFFLGEIKVLRRLLLIHFKILKLY